MGIMFTAEGFIVITIPNSFRFRLFFSFNWHRWFSYIKQKKSRSFNMRTNTCSRFCAKKVQWILVRIMFSDCWFLRDQPTVSGWWLFNIFSFSEGFFLCVMHILYLCMKACSALGLAVVKLTLYLRKIYMDVHVKRLVIEKSI